MKSNLKERTFEAHGSGDSVGMSIQSSAKIVNILIDNIYSDKPKAIYREMISNGYDAQKEAGTLHIPPDVVMPDVWSQTFRFRDYGTGLSHEFMLNEYCQIGYSTKELTNESVGKWGLGRLVPLSYTDTYTVVSYRGGIARHYTVSRTSSGISCVPMGSAPTDEPNGLEVSFPIDRQDLLRFSETLKYISLGLDVKPRVINQPDFQWPEVPVSVKGNGWTYLDRSKLPYGSPLYNQAHVRMGCVLYPISKEYDFSGESVILEAPIGSLAVTASREALSYGPDEPTDRTIRRLLKRFSEEIVQEQVQHVQSAGTYTEALIRYAKAMQSLRTQFQKSFLGKCSHWGGYRLHQRATFDVDILRWWDYSGANRVQVTSSGNWTLHATELTNVAIVVENVTQGNRDIRGPKRILEWWRSFESDKRPEYLAWVRFDENDKQQAQELIGLLSRYPDVPVYSVSEDMPDIPKERRASKPVQAKLLKEGATGFYTGAEDVSIPDDVFQKGGYYLKTERNDPVYKQKTMTDRHFCSLLNRARSLGEFKDTKVYVAPKTIWKRFEDNPRWVEIYPKIEPAILKHRAGLVKSAASYSGGGVDSFLHKLGGYSKLVDRYLSGWEETNYLNLTPRDCRIILEEINVQLPPSLKELKEKQLAEIYQKYPLLKNRSYGADLEHYRQYLRMADCYYSTKGTKNVEV